MLQISQTEKPICSAIIDQMRLRRATNLPVEFQNFSFSGSQSEIHVVFGLLIVDFLSDGFTLVTPVFPCLSFPSRRPKTKSRSLKRACLSASRTAALLSAR